MIKSDVLIESKSLRESVIDRVDVLERVNNLELLPDDVYMTIDMGSNFYQVGREAIQSIIHDNRKELESDGLKVLKGNELKSLKEIGLISKNTPHCTVFPRRALLRMGMLLRDSIVAQILRDKLLDTESEKRVQTITNIVQIPTELNLMGQLLEVSNQSFKAMLTMQKDIDETKIVAVSASERANAAETQAKLIKADNERLQEELDDIKKGLVDVEIPLRTQFNDAVRKYAKRHSLEWDDAYNNIYSVLAKQNHVDLKKRLQNKVERGEKAKMVDVVEELNLLVPAIRLAKTMAGVAI